MISINSVTKHFGNQLLFKNASFQVNAGDKVGLTGTNGAGKTTIFRILNKTESLEEGSVTIPDKVRMAYFSQNVGEMRGKTALSEVLEGNKRAFELSTQISILEKQLEDAATMDPDEMQKVLDNLGEFQEEFEKIGGYDLESSASEILTGLGIGPADHGKMTEEFSGGWKMRIALAKVLIAKPDIILMDEPTNYLDLETIEWLELWLKNFKGAILLTTHDREFMNNIIKKTVEISNGTITTYSGNYDYYLKEREIRRKQLEAAHSRQQDMLAKEEDFIARFAARASHAAQVQSRVKKLDKIDRVELPPEDKAIEFVFPIPPRGSNDVVVMKELGKCWKKNGQENWIFKNLTAQINRLDKVAVVGVNGAGKSTLLKVITGLTDATSGEVVIGPSIKVGYFGQFTLEVLKPEMTVFEEVRSRLREASDSFIRNLLAAFLFRGDDVFKKVKFLSGGEKSRLILAALMAENNNLLILDEPTNHLDIKSREVLLEALQNYQGTVIFVSHDRFFLNSLATRVLEVDKGGVRNFDGPYSFYLEKSGRSR